MASHTTHVARAVAAYEVRSLTTSVVVAGTGHRAGARSAIDDRVLARVVGAAEDVTRERGSAVDDRAVAGATCAAVHDARKARWAIDCVSLAGVRGRAQACATGPNTARALGRTGCSAQGGKAGVWAERAGVGRGVCDRAACSSGRDRAGGSRQAAPARSGRARCAPLVAPAPSAAVHPARAVEPLPRICLFTGQIGHVLYPARGEQDKGSADRQAEEPHPRKVPRAPRNGSRHGQSAKLSIKMTAIPMSAPPAMIPAQVGSMF